MQKIADETRVVSVNLTQEQYLWVKEHAQGRRLSSFFRDLVDKEMAKQSDSS